MSNKVKLLLHDADITYCPMWFRGLWSDGYCHMRVIIQDGFIIFRCSQLVSYYGTSISNAVTSVRDSIVKKLMDEKILKVKRNRFLEILKSEQQVEDADKRAVYEFLDKHSIWIECYEKTTINRNDDLYRIVKFDNSPSYDTCSIKALSDAYGIDLSVRYCELTNWDESKRMDSVAIKKLIASKGWTLKEIAQRWNRSEGWMSKVINDSERPRYWDDAFHGLVSKNKL
ncbi:TPA: hypothetical protein ACX6RV_002998 [Photobacterium damselae]